MKRKSKMNPGKGKDLGMVIAIGTPKGKKDGMNDHDMDSDADDNLDHRNMACVPVNTLSEDGVAPQPGDEVNFTVDGKVEHVEGENAYVSITKVNGQNVAGGEGEEEGEEEEPEEGEEEGEEGEQGFNKLREASRRHDMSRGFTA